MLVVIVSCFLFVPHEAVKPNMTFLVGHFYVCIMGFFCGGGKPFQLFLNNFLQKDFCLLGECLARRYNFLEVRFNIFLYVYITHPKTYLPV